MDNEDWEGRVADAWASFDDRSEPEFVALIESLAVPLYRQALDRGLTGERRRRAVIQLASSLRNLGQAEESVALLRTELAAGSDHLDDAVRAFLALALVDTGQEREAVSLALTALVPPPPLPDLAGGVRPAPHILIGPRQCLPAGPSPRWCAGSTRSPDRTA